MALLASGATVAYFSDTESSNGNNFTAGTLNLTVNGNDGINTVLFNVSNLRPGSQPTGRYTIRNTGSVAGYLDIENVSFASNENGRIEPEVEAGDASDDTGELDDVLNLRMYLDNDKDGYYSVGDRMFYNGLVKNIPSHFELDEPVAAGSGVEVVSEVYDWWNTSIDNQAQNDSLVINSTMELSQTAGQ